METDRDAQGMRVGHVKVYRTATDLPKGQVCRGKDCKQIGLLKFFLIHKTFLCQSIADP